MEEDKRISIVYTNYKGETAIRQIIPKEITFGSNQWHTEDQWLLLAFDLEKKADRTFALKDVRYWY